MVHLKPVRVAERARGDRGVVLAMFALLIAGLLIVATIAIDFGRGAVAGRRAQAAVDASALAAAQDLPTSATAVATAATYAAYNMGLSSFGTGSACGSATCFSAGGWSLTITTPYQGNVSQINVRVCGSVASAFGGLIGRPTVNVCSSASARVRTGSVRQGADVVTLAPSGSNSLTCSGSCALSGGSVVVNSTDSKGLTVSGGGTITVDTIAVGASTVNGVSSPANVTCGDNIYGTGSCPTKGSATADPYANLQPPTMPTTHYPGGSYTGTIQPGVYDGSLNVSSTTATFAPGVYWLTNGLNASGSSRISGDHVLFYVAGGKFTLSGGTIGSFTTLQDGSAWSDMLIFQARTNTNTMTLSGGSGLDLDGTVYNPAGATSITGGSGTPGGISQVVTNTLTISGSSYIGANATGGGGSGTGTLELYE